MQCESCGKKPAEFTVYRVSDAGCGAERNLCGTCARDYEKIYFGSGSLLLTDMIQTIESDHSGSMVKCNRTKVCPKCGNTIEEVIESGVLGCSDCYEVFRSEVDCVIRELHGYPRNPE